MSEPKRVYQGEVVPPAPSIPKRALRTALGAIGGEVIATLVGGSPVLGRRLGALAASPEVGQHVEKLQMHLAAFMKGLKKSGQHTGTGNPGEHANLVFSAHNDIFGEIFRDLDRLNPGDLVIVYTNRRAYTYIVVDTRIVMPTAVEVMDTTTQASVTLISCYPYLKDTQRIVVIARLQT